MLTVQLDYDHKLASVKVMSLDPAQPGALRYQGDRELIQFLMANFDQASSQDLSRMFGSPAEVSSLIASPELVPYHPEIIEPCEGCGGNCQTGVCPKRYN